MVTKAEFNDNDYQEHYRLTYSPSGRTYMFVRPAYRYGYEMALEKRFTGRNWNDSTETDLRRTWESRGAAMRWDDARAAILEGWNRARGVSKPRALGSSTYDLNLRDVEG